MWGWTRIAPMAMLALGAGFSGPFIAPDIHADVHAEPPVRVVNCTVQETSAVQGCVSGFQSVMAEWITRLDQRYGYTEGRKFREEFPDAQAIPAPVEWSAIETLECMSRVLERNHLYYHCAGATDGGDAWTLPVVGREIRLSSSFFDRSEGYRCGAILHEVSHKCGTTDSDYFEFPYHRPRSSRWVHWSGIADTYYYWRHHGFCIPGEDC